MRSPNGSAVAHSEIASDVWVHGALIPGLNQTTSYRRALRFIGSIAIAFGWVNALGHVHAAEIGSVPEPTADLSRWTVEQMPGGTVTSREGALVIEDAAGCTVWFHERLTAPVEITYEVTVVSKGGPHDRVSDVNCFWMAQDPAAPDGCPFAPAHTRSGRFSDYDSLFTYYVGMGGNENTTTRFRRYNGTSDRPLLPEHDLRDRSALLEPNRTYHIRLVARDGIAEYWSDGKKLLSFTDPAPLSTGWFGVRTIQSHLEVRNLQIKSSRGSTSPASTASAP